MAAEGMQFPWRRKGNTIPPNLGVICEMSNQMSTLENTGSLWYYRWRNATCDADSKINLLFLYGEDRHLLGTKKHWGHCDIIKAFDHDPFENRILFLKMDEIGKKGGAAFKIELPDIVVNCITDADIHAKSLERAGALCDILKVPVINHPRRMPAMTRENTYRVLHDIDGLLFPKTIRLKWTSLRNFEETISTEDLQYPILVRETGTHSGLRLVKADNPKTFERIIIPEGLEIYVTQFVDFRGTGDYYWKSRFVIVNGKFIPYHHLCSNSWMVNQGIADKLMKQHHQLLNEEKRFVFHSDEFIRPCHIEAVNEIYRRIKLDYFAVDCAMLEDGRLLIFEVNASIDLFKHQDKITNEHQLAPRHKIIAALSDLCSERLNRVS